MYGRLFLSHSFVAAIALLDQFLKSWAVRAAPRDEVGFLGVMHIVPTWNRGIAFGLFNWLEYGNNLFLVVATALCVYLYQALLGAKPYQKALGYAMVLGGAIGNIIDRVVHCSVLDFVDLSLNGRHFPAFNLADLAVTVGACVLVVHFLSSLRRA